MTSTLDAATDPVGWIEFLARASEFKEPDDPNLIASGGLWPHVKGALARACEEPDREIRARLAAAVARIYCAYPRGLATHAKHDERHRWRLRLAEMIQSGQDVQNARALFTKTFGTVPDMRPVLTAALGPLPPQPRQPNCLFDRLYPDDEASPEPGTTIMRGKPQKPPTTPEWTYDGPLRTLSGERGEWQGGHYFFAPRQGEWHKMPGRFGGIDRQIGLVPLNNGKWLAAPPGLWVWERQFDSREHALRCAVAAIIRRMRSPRYPWPIGRQERAEVIEWLRSLLPPSPVDQARDYGQRVAWGHTVEEIAKAEGRTPDEIEEALALLELPENVLRRVRSRKRGPVGEAPSE